MAVASKDRSYGAGSMPHQIHIDIYLDVIPIMSCTDTPHAQYQAIKPTLNFLTGQSMRVISQLKIIDYATRGHR